MSAPAAFLPPEISAADVLVVVAEYLSVSTVDLVGPGRERDVRVARQKAMYLCSELTDLSAHEIGAFFGGRDHTVALHAGHKVRSLMSERLVVRTEIAEMAGLILKRHR